MASAIWGDQCLVDGQLPEAVLLTRRQVDPYFDEDNLIFLGLFRDRPAFAVAISKGLDAPFGKLGEFQSLRHLGTILPADEAHLVAHARALVLWHQSQVYCGICGSATVAEAGGNSRRCRNADRPYSDPTFSFSADTIGA